MILTPGHLELSCYNVFISIWSSSRSQDSYHLTGNRKPDLKSTVLIWLGIFEVCVFLGRASGVFESEMPKRITLKSRVGYKIK